MATDTMDQAAFTESLLREEDPQSLRMQEYTSIKHVLPKTKIHHAILHENVSQDRHLQMKLDRIRVRRENYLSNHELSRRSFLEKQNRKHRKWKRDDEMRVSGMTLPHMTPNFSRRPSMSIVYRSPSYSADEGDEELKDVTMLPFMSVRRERTEIIQHGEGIYMTRLPTLIEVDSLKLKRYNSYCGSENLNVGKPLKDNRFTAIVNSLTPREEATDPEEQRRKMKQRTKSFYSEYSDDGSDAEVEPEKKTMEAAPRPNKSDNAPDLPTRTNKTPQETRVVFPVVISKFKNKQGLTTRERLFSLEKESSRYEMDVRSRTISSGSRPKHPRTAFVGNSASYSKDQTDAPAPGMSGREKLKSDIKTKSLKELQKGYGKLQKSQKQDTSGREDRPDRPPASANVKRSSLQLLETVESGIK